ncbi:unnamed protein product, partial [Rotaria sordida]
MCNPIQIYLVILASCVPECKNSGTCIMYNNCSCTTGFTGPTCEIQSVGLCHDNGTVGVDPIFLTTFGNGSVQYSTATPDSFNFSTQYAQQNGPGTIDGMFSFVNLIPDDFAGTWHINATDHTGDEGGYMMLVNGDFRSGEFYRSQVNDLCVGLRYELSAYLANIGVPSDLIEPNVRFEVRSSMTENL